MAEGVPDKPCLSSTHYHENEAHVCVVPADLAGDELPRALSRGDLEGLAVTLSAESLGEGNGILFEPFILGAAPIELEKTRAFSRPSLRPKNTGSRPLRPRRFALGRPFFAFRSAGDHHEQKYSRGSPDSLVRFVLLSPRGTIR